MEAAMIPASECRAHSAQCTLLGKAPDISIQRATILLAMAHTWTALANQQSRLDDTIASESVQSKGIAMEQSGQNQH
jgi:hypothetical protein